MIFRSHSFKPLFVIPVVIALLMLSGCPGQDDNEAQSGLVMHVAETHLEAKLTKTSAAVATANVAALASVTTTRSTTTLSTTSLTSPATDATLGFTTLAVTGGYDRNNIEHHDIIDGSSHLLSIYRAYFVVDEIKMVTCASLSQLPRWLLNSLIPSAEAHAGHGAEPVGGRSLDEPNVIDIVTQDEYILPLGDLAIAPGSYCGVRISFARASGDAYGKPTPAAASEDDPTTVPDVPDMTGKLFAMRADYCSTSDGMGGCAGRTKVDIDDAGLAVPATRTISFSPPLEVNSGRRSAYVTVGIAYGEWATDVDVSILASDFNERQKLLNNIADSVHVYSRGLGDLP